MAFAVADPTNPIDDFEDYFVVRAKQYSYDVNTSFTINERYFESHRCSDAELGLDDS